MGGFYRLSELGFALPAGPQVLSAEDVGALEAATALVRAAEERAAAILGGAEAAREARRREGYAAGLEEAGREALRRLLGEAAALDAGLAALEADLAELVAACVRRLMSDFDDRARAEAVVRDGLKRMRREKRAELRVSPAQFAALKASIGAIAAEFPEVELVDVVEDPDLAPPAVVLETRVGRVEANVSAELEALEALLRGGGRSAAEAAP